MELVSKMVFILIFVLLLILSPIRGESSDESYIISVPQNKQKLINGDVDVEASFQKARCFFNKSQGDRWLKAMWYVESSQAESSTIVIGDDGQSYGPFQIRVAAVRTIDNIYSDLNLSSMSDADIAYSLLFNFEFSVEMAARYLGHLETRFQIWSSAIEGYNRGPGGVTKGRDLGLPYYNKVYRAFKNQIGIPHDVKICKEVTSKI